MNGWLALAVAIAVVCKMLTDLGLAYMNRIYGPKRGEGGRFTK